ncbi:MAG: hypothetical protein ACRDSZ_19210, partial [Pseudonocardiaceae bacterium]
MLDLSTRQARARVHDAEHLATRRTLTGEVLPARLPATAPALASALLRWRSAGRLNRSECPHSVAAKRNATLASVIHRDQYDLGWFGVLIREKCLWAARIRGFEVLVPAGWRG